MGARLVAQGLPGLLGQAVIVENRVAPAAYCRGHRGQSTARWLHRVVRHQCVWLAPFLRDNVGYDPVKSFVPIILVARSPSVLVVHPSVPANSVKEFIALAKAKPGQLNYGSGPQACSRRNY